MINKFIYIGLLINNLIYPSSSFITLYKPNKVSYQNHNNRKYYMLMNKNNYNDKNKSKIYKITFNNDDDLYEDNQYLLNKLIYYTFIVINLYIYIIYLINNH